MHIPSFKRDRIIICKKSNGSRVRKLGFKSGSVLLTLSKPLSISEHRLSVKDAMFPKLCAVSCELLILIMEKEEKNEIQTVEEMLDLIQLSSFPAGLLRAFNPLVNTASPRGGHTTHTL